MDWSQLDKQPKATALTIARNQVVDRARKLSIRKKHGAEETPAEDLTVYPQRQPDEIDVVQIERIKAVLHQLPPRQRDVIALTLEGYESDEVAADLGIGAVRQAEAAERAWRTYSGHVTRLGLAGPQDEASFTDLLTRLPGLRRQAEEHKRDLDPALNQARGEAGAAARLLQDKAAELRVLRSARSLIPAHARERREQIADGAGIAIADLPYAAELIDIADGHERWRPAAEKVLRSFGLRLLVPDRHQQAVQEFIDTHDMRGVIDYSVVTGTSAHQPRPAEATLAAKLSVDAGHPCGLWLSGQIAKRFDHVCVESARDLDHHRVAVTLRGTVKLPGGHYRKDDRPELTRVSSYILGANTAAKRAALEHEVRDLEEAAAEAARDADALDEQVQTLRSRIQAATDLTHYASWVEVDHWTARRAAHAIRDRIEELRSGDTHLQSLQEQAAAAKQAWEDLVAACALLRTARDTGSRRLDRLTAALQDEQHRPDQVADEAERAVLDEVLLGLDAAFHDVSSDAMKRLAAAFRAALVHRREAADGRRRVAVAGLSAAISAFLDKWPDAAPDTSGDPERSGGAFAALHTEITTRKLPAAMKEFQRIIGEEMLPTIVILDTTIDQADKDIRQRLDMVNTALRKVEFIHGIHLQIKADHRRCEATAEFKRLLDVLWKHNAAAKSDPAELTRQFKRVRDLMARFTRTDPDTERWRRDVLDVRLSYTFYGREEDHEGATVHTYRNTASNSGGEQEKLVAFCLAAALSYNLADASSGGRPRFAPLMLDEAFSKSDETFSSQALSAFEEFGFQLLVAAPIRMSGVLEPFIGQALLVEKRLTEGKARSHAVSATFGELAAHRTVSAGGAVLAAS